MPETKFQDFIYTLIMAFLMVYVMICYNISIHTGGLSNFVFLEAFKELPLIWIVAIILEFFLIGKIAHKLTFKVLVPKKTPSIIISYGIWYLDESVPYVMRPSPIEPESRVRLLEANNVASRWFPTRSDL